MGTRRGIFAGLVASVGLAVLATPLATQPSQAETVLRGAMFIDSDRSLFRQLFNEFVERVNTEGAGMIRIDPVLGPGAIPTSEMPNALREGIIDIAGLPPAFYRGQVFEASGLQVAEVPPDVQRARGAIDMLQEKYHDAGWHLLAQYGYGLQFHFFMNTPVEGVGDFADLTLRTTPTYRAFFNDLGSRQVETSRGEVYTAMERGVVDGFANVMSESAAAGWDEVARYLVEPGFYHTIVTIMMNRDSWERLDSDQQALLDRIAMEVENELAADLADRDRAAGAEMVDRGLEVIALPEAEASRLVEMANDAYWSMLEADAPETIGILRPLLSAD